MGITTRLKFVEVRFTFTACHRYENAPTGVSFLSLTHRHRFHVRARVEVFHNDREVEFILLQRYLQNYANEHMEGKISNDSCESMAFRFAGSLEKYFKNDGPSVTRVFEIEVSEDGENGAVIQGEFNAKQKSI